MTPEETRAYQVKYREDNREELRAYFVEYNKKRRDYTRKHRRDNIERVRMNKRNWYHKNREEILSKIRIKNSLKSIEVKAAESNRRKTILKTEAQKDAKKSYLKKYRKDNRAELRNKARIYEAQKKKDNIAFKMLGVLRGRISNAIRSKKEKIPQIKKCAKTIDLVGCSMPFFLDYISSKFIYGMSWINHGKNGWHVDHIIPCAYFDISKPEHQRKCFHYTNLQPLWARDNLRKNKKLDYTPTNSNE